MASTLAVAYVSQIMSGGLEHNNDCGAASSLMLLRTYNLAMNTTVDQFYNSIIPNGDVAISAGQMQARMAQLGLKNIWKVGLTIDMVFSFLKEKKPLLALIHYAPLVDAGLTEKKGFRGAHFIVITGIDLDSVYINDPYRTDSLVNNAIPHAVFEKAWEQCTLDGNPVGGAIIPTLPIQDLTIPTPTPAGEEYYVMVNGLNVRSLPSSYGTLVRTIWRTVEPVIRIEKSTLINGYVKLADNTGWVWMEYLKKK